jgi:hypothetical protein
MKKKHKHTEIGAVHLKDHVLRSVDEHTRARLVDLNNDCTISIDGSRRLDVIKSRDEITITNGLFFVRVRVDASGEWLPIEFKSDSTNMQAEREVNGRRMINVPLQIEITDIANTWGKALAAVKIAHRLWPN